MVSVEGKGMAETVSGEAEGDECKRTTDEVSKTKGRRQNWRRTLLQDNSGGEPVSCLDGVRHKSGMTLIQALVWNVGTCRSDEKGETQVEDPRE